MARKIEWTTPSELTVTNVEINRATDIYGSYSVIETIAATSDEAAKSISNTWVTTYTDTTGEKTHWYKIRFYDSDTLLWSPYSEPITAEELTSLCSVADIKRTIDTVGRWSDSDIYNMILDTDETIYIESYTPVQSSWSEIGKIDSTVQDRYYVGEENIYRVDRVFYGTTTKIELFLDDKYKANLKYGMIEILPVGSSGITLDIVNDIEIQYVPDVYHKLSLYRTCQALLEQVDATSGGTTSKELTVMIRKVEMIETLLMHRIGVQLSSSVKYYNGVYGINKKHVRQNFDRNKYIGGINW